MSNISFGIEPLPRCTWPGGEAQGAGKVPAGPQPLPKPRRGCGVVSWPLWGWEGAGEPHQAAPGPRPEWEGRGAVLVSSQPRMQISTHASLSALAAR